MSFNGENTQDATAAGETPLLEIDEPISSGDFLPEIDFNDFIKVERINREYRVDSITHQLLIAITRVTGDLTPRLTEWQEAGYTTLADVPSLELGSILAFELQYKEAVYVWAKCALMQEYATMNRKDQAENVGKEAHARCPSLMQRYADAIAYLKGEPQGVVTSII